MVRDRAPWFRVGVLFALFCAFSSCSSTPDNVHEIKKLVYVNMRVRRPPVPAADPKAGPGGLDYRTEPLPNAAFDCEKLEWLFREMPLAAVRECLGSFGKEAKEISYRARRAEVPYLELEEEDETPACIKANLKKIPIPREIFFQKYDGEAFECYAAGFDVHADEMLGVKLPKNRVGIEILLPLREPPKNDDETIRLLSGWAMTPLFNEDNNLLAKPVPRAICKRCIGEKNLLRDDDPEQKVWP